MKKFLLFLLVIMLFSPSFACISDSISIDNVNVSFYDLSVALLVDARYNYYDVDYIYLISLNDSNIGLRITNQSLEFSILTDMSVLIDDVIWGDVLRTDLLWLVNNSIINLSENNIDLVSAGGCCHTYSLLNDSLEESFASCLDDGFIIPIIDSSLSWISVFLSIIPVLILSFYFARIKKNYWLAFLIGCVGWFIASFRTQIFSFIYLVPDFLILIFFSSILAGVCEEVVRYLLFKHTDQAKKNPLLFGLGWGFIEALLIYVATISSYILLNQPVTFYSSLLGAFERNVAVLMHVALSFIVFKSLKDIKYLYLGIGLHFFFDFFSAFSYYVLGVNALFLEVLLFVFTLILFSYSYKLNKKFIKKLV